ncbi:MAG TPA: helix-turn-helix transcriptional regulator [Burkholderiaceae bacterium]|nr:helix-turn-helix transcriptional regulator [Burkholderiaceae bacterium]
MAALTRRHHNYLNLHEIITVVIGTITNVIALHRSITNVNHFADRLRHARRLRGLSQAELAKASGLSQGAIANYESKTRQSAKGIFQLAQALQVSPAWLSMGTGPMETPESSAGSQVTYELSDKMLRREHHEAWPFTSASAEDFWSLSKEERAVIDTTLGSLIRSLRNKRADL